MAGHGSFTSTLPFTEDLKICNCTGVGFQPNHLYERDGQRKNEHEPEDKSFHYLAGDNIALYGVFDGTNGQAAAEYVMHEMPGQILLGQLSDNSTEVEIFEVLKQAFLTVERGYFQAVVDPLLVQRSSLSSEVVEEPTSVDFYSAAELQQRSITSSAAVLVVLMFNRKLYVANAGDCRALVCVSDSGTGTRDVVQLSVNHDLKNNEERERLRSLNLNVDVMEGKLERTRFIGNYLAKGGYKENPVLETATGEPILAEPEITSYPVTESTRFLILLSSGLYKALEEVTDHINPLLAEMIMEEFTIQTTMNGVVQAVVDRVARSHQELPRVCRVEDMTLLVRNFNYPLRSQRSSPLTDRYVLYPSSSLTPFTPTFTGPLGFSLDEPDDPDTVSGETETNSSSSSASTKQKTPEKIKPYVDFSPYYDAVRQNPDLLNDDYFFTD